MILQQIHIVNYKNYKDVHADLHPRFNLISGQNGKGKTNFIDAIYYLGLTRSFFNNTDVYNYRHGEAFFRLDGLFLDNEKSIKLVAKVQKKGLKVFEKNDKKYERLIQHIGSLPIVMIAPKDQSLITEGSEERRRLINSTISQIDSVYLQNLLQYRHVLKQRNQYLKDYSFRGDFDLALLDIYDNKLSEAGQQIYSKRKEYLSLMEPVFRKQYALISDQQEDCLFIYKSQLGDKPLVELLAEAREKDRILQRTSCGIHKDDLVFFNEENRIKNIGSQGQQKSFVMALKLAQFQLINSQTAKSPIVLLDDIFDKLDSKRVLQLIKLLYEQDLGQVFITDTEKDRVKSIFDELNYDYKAYWVEENQLNSTDEEA